ncbi:MAG: molybdopterin-guanine dinucleotide biosynthesis protein B [Deltaproteobacteria bacterium]|nr:molybdopterin-guanine dinucleotide biosynthesis protein B [Deltaproteobacteria bacterium]MBN2688303.1 molybdopterin-guanine dinucleotide biosynthesis protein B [Deltaproteobacteria bacterium]
MIPILSIIGKSNSGKTTLVEKLIHELRQRGYRVATIKHNRHGFDIDHEGKDSWRHKQAGAKMTVIASPAKVAVVEDIDRDYTIEELVGRFIHDVDIVLVEGFKKNTLPKIEVFRKELNRELISIGDNSLIAVAGNYDIDIDVPCFDRNDAKDIADFIEEQVLKGMES